MRKHRSVPPGSPGRHSRRRAATSRYSFQPRWFRPDNPPRVSATVNGTLIGIGYNGFCYSSSANGSGGVYLYFGVTHLNPSSSDYRGHGIQLRCLSE